MYYEELHIMKVPCDFGSKHFYVVRDMKDLDENGQPKVIWRSRMVKKMTYKDVLKRLDKEEYNLYKETSYEFYDTAFGLIPRKIFKKLLDKNTEEY